VPTEKAHTASMFLSANQKEQVYNKRGEWQHTMNTPKLYASTQN